jgi:hypothetical protein
LLLNQIHHLRNPGQRGQHVVNFRVAGSRNVEMTGHRGRQERAEISL